MRSHSEPVSPKGRQGNVPERILESSPGIRYVAVYRNEQLETASRAAAASSDAESDKYEELLVNPAILKLVAQRGNLDCGGARYVLIRYGNFYQWVRTIRDGHVSVCIEPEANPLELSVLLESELQRNNLL
jgi:hypothetical protein